MSSRRPIGIGLVVLPSRSPTSPPPRPAGRPGAGRGRIRPRCHRPSSIGACRVRQSRRPRAGRRGRRLADRMALGRILLDVGRPRRPTPPGAMPRQQVGHRLRQLAVRRVRRDLEPLHSAGPPRISLMRVEEPAFLGLELGAEGLAQLLEQLALLAVRLRGILDRDDHQLVAAAVALQVGDALALQRQDLPGLRPGGDGQAPPRRRRSGR